MGDYAELKIYAIDAVILVLHNHAPTRERLLRWSGHRIRPLIIISGQGIEAIHAPLQLQDLADVLVVPETTWSSKDAFRKILKEGMDRLSAKPVQTVLATDEARIIHEAGKNRYALLIGINSDKEKGRFYQEGADLVVNKLDDISLYDGNTMEPWFNQTLPNIFSLQFKFQTIFMDREPVFFFDYDGTLTPIVQDPSKAFLREDMKNLLKSLSRFHTVAVVSGRDLEDIRKLIQLDNIIYAGSHGFRISGPGGMYMEHENAKHMISGLDRIESSLRKGLENQIKGLEIERKSYALAIHYRNSPPGSFGKINARVSELIRRNPDFRRVRGKKILEIRPALDWNKGKAIEWILQSRGLDDMEKYCPVYLGDDLTDEDAFRSLADNGLGILVGDHGKASAAGFRLRDVDQVQQFLHYAIQSEL